MLDRFARGGPTGTTDDPSGEWTGDIGVRTGEAGEVMEGGLFQVIKKKLLKEVLAGFHYLLELTALFPAAEPSMAAVGGKRMVEGEHRSAEAH